MNKTTIDNFFDNAADCAHFAKELMTAGRASVDGAYIASLTKDRPDQWLYKLQHRDTDFYMGEHVKPFDPTDENVALFNEGCAEMTRRYQAYMERGHDGLVPGAPPAFGSLAHLGDEQIETAPDSGDGRTPESRIVLKVQGGHSAYIAAEYGYIRQLYGKRGVDWTMLQQQLLPSRDGRRIDAITIKLKSGEEHILYFDLTPVWPPTM